MKKTRGLRRLENARSSGSVQVWPETRSRHLYVRYADFNAFEEQRLLCDGALVLQCGFPEDVRRDPFAVQSANDLIDYRDQAHSG